MRAWRLALRRHQRLLDGRGNRDSGARWNSPGRGVVYATENPSLALLETLVHLDPDLLPRDMTLIELAVPEDAGVIAISLADYPSDWRRRPDWFRRTGDAWLTEGTALVLSAPSAVMPHDRNIMLNPAHARLSEVQIVRTSPFELDPRLIT